MANSVLGVRVALEDRQLVEKTAKARGEDMSDLIRRAIRKELASLGVLPIEQKQALDSRRWELSP